MKKYLDKCEYHSVTSKNLYKLVEIVLKPNYFEFGQDVYQQLLGIAIGTKFAPPYANIFMAGLEEEMFKNPKFFNHFCGYVTWTTFSVCGLKVLTNWKSSSITLMNSNHQLSLLWSILKKKLIFSMFLLPNLIQVKNCAQVPILNPQTHTSTYTLHHVIELCTKTRLLTGK